MVFKKKLIMEPVTLSSIIGDKLGHNVTFEMVVPSYYSLNTGWCNISRDHVDGEICSYLDAMYDDWTIKARKARHEDKGVSIVMRGWYDGNVNSYGCVV